MPLTEMDQYKLQLLLHVIWCGECRPDLECKPANWDLCRDGRSFINTMRFAEIGARHAE